VHVGTLVRRQLQAAPGSSCRRKPSARGREGAKINQIKTVGSLGVLLLAKRASLTPRVAPLIDQIASSPVFMGAALIHAALELTNESDK